MNQNDDCISWATCANVTDIVTSGNADNDATAITTTSQRRSSDDTDSIAEDIERSLQALQRHTGRLFNKQGKMQSDLDALDSRNKELSAEITQLTVSLHECQAGRDSLRGRLQESQDRQERATTGRAELKKLLDESDEKLQCITTDRKSLEKKFLNFEVKTQQLAKDKSFVEVMIVLLFLLAVLSGVLWLFEADNAAGIVFGSAGLVALFLTCLVVSQEDYLGKK